MVNSHGNVVIPIPGEIMAVDTKERVVSARGVYDYNLVKDQETINSEVQANIQNLQNQIDTAGEGGTTNYSELINKPKINNIELEGNVTLEIPDSYTKEQSDALHNALQRSIEGKANTSDVYTQQQINSKVKTLEDRISEIEDHSGATFDPDQYYTKTQSDEKYQGVGDYLTSSDIAGKVNTSDFNIYKNSSDTRFTNLERDKVSGATLSETLRNYALKSELPEGTTVDNFINGTSTNPVQNKIIYSALQNKQDALVSGTNIKALRSNNAQDQSLVGNGFINFKTINGNSIFGTEDIKVATGEGGGEQNVIDNIKVNGNFVPIIDQTAEITISVPTALSELSSDENHNTVSETQIEGWNNKIGGNELKTINGQSILVNGNDKNLVVNPANDSNLVHKTGTESVTGAKTFSDITVNGIKNINMKSVNNLYDTNGKIRSLSDIIREFTCEENEENVLVLKTTIETVRDSSLISSSHEIRWSELIRTPEINNTIIYKDNDIYYLQYKGGNKLIFKNIDNSSSKDGIIKEKIITVFYRASEDLGYYIEYSENISSLTPTQEIFDSNYLTITSLEDNNSIYFSSTAQSNSELKTIEYSTDNGNTWNSVTAEMVVGVERSYTDEYGLHKWTEFSTTEQPQEICILNNKEKVLLRGNNTDYIRHHFLSSKDFDISGNIMSLCYSETFETNTTLPSSSVFENLFEGCVNLNSAEDLILPSSTLTNDCYAGMFKNCSKLNIPPKLPALVLSNGCYSSMFEGCRSLLNSPSLPATELADYCYSSMFKGSGLRKAPILPATELTYRCYAYMFENTLITSIPTLPSTPASSSYYGMFMDCKYLDIEEGRSIIINGNNSSCCQEMFMGCTSLTRAPKLPSSRVGEKAYYSMFEGCTSLIQAPKLPAKVLLPQTGHTFGLNYAYMFKGCTSLTTAPKLPATELTMGCYMGMFWNCSNLVTAPELPATEFTESYSHSQDLSWCYEKMFKNCVKLQEAPILPATVLTQGCYQEMFYGCSSLNYINCYAQDISATDCTNSWVAGSSAIKTFSSQEEEYEEMLQGIPYKYGSNTQYIYTVTQTNAVPGITISDDFNPYDMRTWPEEYRPNARSSRPDYNYSYYDFVLPGWYAYYTYTINHWDNSDPPQLVEEVKKYTYMPALDAEKGYNYLWVSKREYNKDAQIIDENGEVIDTGGWGEYQTPVLLQYLSSENIGVASEGTFVKGNNSNWSIGINGIPTNWTTEISPYTQYLTFDILTGGTINWNCSGINYSKEISYSTNDGETWTTINSTTSINVVANDKLLVKGSNTSYWSDTTTRCKFSSSNGATFNLSGNIMSLVHGDDFIGKDSLDDGQVDINGNHGWPNIFRGLFSGCSGLKSAKNLILPTTLSVGCFREMFVSSGITIAPKLPALKMTKSCYSSMFSNCQSLTTVFDLPSTELATDCYSYMFENCSSLTTAPELPATKLYNYCYQGMFQGTAITESPELPATVLVPNCYSYMFGSCTNLNKITCNAYDISATSCTESWVDDVASTGVFIGNSSVNWTTGINGIPEGWTFSDTNSSANAKPNSRPFYDEETGQYIYPIIRYDQGHTSYFRKFLTFEILSDGIIKWKTDFDSNSKTIYYSRYREEYWHEITSSLNGAQIEVKAGEILIFKGENISYEYNHFDTSVQFNIYGNITSLLYGNTNYMHGEGPGDKGKIYDNISANSVFKELFKDCFGLISAEHLILYPRTLTESCYAGMFKNCINLQKSPELQATTLANGCYQEMFENCINLITAPPLSAVTLYQNCYSRMFYGCIKLNNVKCLATTLETNATTDWLEGVAVNGTFVKNSTTVWPTGNSGIPTGWTVQ